MRESRKSVAIVAMSLVVEFCPLEPFDAEAFSRRFDFQNAKCPTTSRINQISSSIGFHSHETINVHRKVLEMFDPEAESLPFFFQSVSRHGFLRFVAGRTPTGGIALQLAQSHALPTVVLS